MKIRVTGPIEAMIPPVPERCAGCGVPLHGCGFDSPVGFLCSGECPARRAALVDQLEQAPVRFSETGLDAPA